MADNKNASARRNAKVNTHQGVKAHSNESNHAHLHLHGGAHTHMCIHMNRPRQYSIDWRERPDICSPSARWLKTDATVQRS